MIASPINTFFKSYTDTGSATGPSSGYTPYTKTPRLQFKLTGYSEAHNHPKCSAARLSLEYGTTRTLPAPLSSYTRTKPSGHQTRPQHAERPCSRVRCDPNWRFRRHPTSRTMLWTCHSSQTQLTEIEGPSIGKWTQSANALGIEFDEQVTILRSYMGPLPQNPLKTACQESYGRYVHKHENPMPEPFVSHSEYNVSSR